MTETVAVENHTHGKQVLQDMAPSADPCAGHPRRVRGLQQLHKAALAPGVLDTKMKELIALAIAVSEECDGCIASTPAAQREQVLPVRRRPRPSA